MLGIAEAHNDRVNITLALESSSVWIRTLDNATVIPTLLPEVAIPNNIQHPTVSKDPMIEIGQAQNFITHPRVKRSVRGNITIIDRRYALKEE